MIRKRERGLSVFDTSGLILGQKVLNRITYSRIRIPKSTVENFCYQKKPVKHLIYNGQLFKNSSSINNVNNFLDFFEPHHLFGPFYKIRLKSNADFWLPPSFMFTWFMDNPFLFINSIFFIKWWTPNKITIRRHSSHIRQKVIS